MMLFFGIMATILQNLEWQGISHDTYTIFSRYFSKMPEKGSEYSFLGLWLYKYAYNLQYAIDGDLFFIRNSKNNTYWTPLGDWNTVDWERYDFIFSKTTFVFVIEQLAMLWKNIYADTIEITENRDDFDYVYDAQELAELSGRKFSKKKNHLNYFLRNTKGYTAAPITEDICSTIEKAYSLWCANTQETFTPLLEAERTLVHDVLQNWSKFINIRGMYIVVEGDVVAFTIGEAMDSRTFTTVIEKSLIDIRGLYQLINKVFAEHIFEAGYTYINRADDYGILGLRKAKESYHPTHFIKKYTVQFL